MVQRLLFFTFLLVVPLAWDDIPARSEGETKSTGIVVTLELPGDTKAAEVIKVLEALKSVKCKETSLRRPSDGKPPTATVTAPPTASSGEVAEVVKVLLDHRLKVVTVEVEE